MTLWNAKQARELNPDCEKISTTTSPLTSRRLTLEIADALIIICEVEVSKKTNKTPCNTKEELKAMITATFSNLNEERVGTAWRRFRSRLEAVFETNTDFFSYITWFCHFCFVHVMIFNFTINILLCPIGVMAKVLHCGL